MADLSEFQRGQIVGARRAGASTTKTAKMFDVSKSTVLKVMTAFEKEEKTSSPKQNSGRKPKLPDRNRRNFLRIVIKDRKSTAPKITAELNDDVEKPVSTKTVRQVLHKAGLHKRATKPDFTDGL